MKPFTSLRVIAAFILLVGMIPALEAQRDYGRARDLVSRATQDLRHVARHDTFAGKDRERYDNALRHLSEFDQGLSKSHYDGGKLDQAIEDIDNVCKNNAVSPEERDTLQTELRDLRGLRSDFK